MNGDFLADSMDYTGTFIIQAIVVLVNVKIFISTHTHTWLSFFWIMISILSFYILFAILNFVDISDLRGVMGIMMSFITNYILLFLYFSGFILVDMGLTFMNNMLEQRYN
mmetsp:Transcript_11553/g.17429  ORF Transcript_11553/g.17429 Transcript_11553/m.17429 type:complete len:110 (+) Transcript_11553:3332-3661(+)